MKANKKQRAILIAIAEVLGWVADCNDINSPSIRTELRRSLYFFDSKLAITDEQANDLEESFDNLMCVIKKRYKKHENN